MLKEQQSALLHLVFSQQHPQCKSQQGSQFNLRGNSQKKSNEALQNANFENSTTFNKGLAIYQHSLLANASRALAITFATVHSLVGKKQFDYLVKMYLQVEFKQQYDWGEFGRSFSAFISEKAVESKLSNASLLSSVAALDFACHQCERSENSLTNLETLNLLTEHDAYHLKIQFSAGMQVICADFPLDEFMQNISQLADKTRTSSFNDVELLMAQFSQQHLGIKTCKTTKEIGATDTYYYLIWRPHFQAQYVQITLVEFDWFSLWLSEGGNADLSIGNALDKMGPDTFSFIDWLPSAIEQQQISAIYIADKTKDY